MHIYAETARLILREIVSTDVDALFELDSDPEVHRYLGNNPVTDKSQIVAIIQNIRRQYEENGIGRWAIVSKETGNLLGWTGLKLVREQTNNHIDFYDLGYRLIRKYWGQGIATESAIASLNYGFDTLRIPTIYGIADINNKGSNRILTKLGFQWVETFYTDDILCNWYQLDKNTWQASNTPPALRP